MTVIAPPPYVLAEAVVASVASLSPSFVRIRFAGQGLAPFGVDGGLFDQRIKLLFPGADGSLPALAPNDPGWWETWCALPEDQRGHLRTYSVRDVIGADEDTQVVVDFVLHLAPGRTGPASSWAARAQPGDRLLLIGPRRGVAWGGIEFLPGDATDLLLVGDETAVPAVSRILADLGPAARGTVFLEVPAGEDVLHLAAPAAVRVTWIAREGRPHGDALIEAVVDHLGSPRVEAVPDHEVDPDLWETPTYSTSGESLESGSVAGIPGLYAWIAGESRLVTTLRRHLVTEVGVDRRQVAFMGYWRGGVARRG